MALTVEEPAANTKIELRKARFRSGGNALVAGFVDFASGLWHYRIWRELAWEDFVKRYRRSYFGALWATVSFMIFALAILFFFASVTGSGTYDMTSYILLGFLVFQLLSNAVNDGANVFISSATWIKSARMPLSLFAFKGITHLLMVFCFNAVGAAILLLWHGYRFPQESYWAIAGFAVILLDCVWVFLLLGVIVSRYRDLSHLISAIMRMAFFVSPILWEPATRGGARAMIALYNPFTHFMAIVREPLLTGQIPVFSWIVVGWISLAGWLIGTLVFCLGRRRVIYWV